MSSKSDDHQKDRSQVKGMIDRRITRSVKCETINTHVQRMPAGVPDDTGLHQAASKKFKKATKHKVKT